MSNEHKPMIDDELDAIKGRLAAITEWPWIAFCRTGVRHRMGITNKRLFDDGDAPEVLDVVELGDNAGGIKSEADAVFIANAPTDIARLLAEVERLREEVKRRDKIVVELKEEVASLQGDLDFSSMEQHILTRKLFDSRICHKAVLCEQKNPQEWKFEGEDGCERCWDEWAWHLATDAIEEAERNAE